MRLVLCGLFLLSMVGGVALPSRAQETSPAKAPQSGQYFSGTVTTSSAASVTVTRRGLGKDSVTRTFSLDSATRIEGRLRVKARVTVRYVPGENGDRAVHIIVR